MELLMGMVWSWYWGLGVGIVVVVVLQGLISGVAAIYHAGVKALAAFDRVINQ